MSLRQVILLLVLAVGCRFQPEQASGRDRDADVPADADATDSRIDTPDAPRADWWNPAWIHRSKITIDNAKLIGSVSNFPILVKLTPASIDYATVNADGSDLRFLIDDGTDIVLDHDLDTFVANGTSLVWVKMPALSNLGPQPTLWLYHGNPAATSSANPAAVFAATSVSVHHLGANFADVTGHSHTGVSVAASTPVTAPGAVGDARKFDGVNDYVTLVGESAFDFTTSVSASAWIRFSGFSVAYQALITKGDSSWRVQRDNTSSFMSFDTTNGTNPDILTGAIDMSDNAWRHLAVVFDGVAKRLYVDGVLDTTKNYTLQLDSNNFAISFGRNEQSATPRYWGGEIDEVRITSLARSAAWISAEYVTVTDATFVQLGPDEPY